MFTCPMCGSTHITQHIIYCAGSAMNHVKCSSCGYDNTKQVTRVSTTTSSYFTNNKIIFSNNTTSCLF